MGPFDFGGNATLNTIYTTNVEEERPSESIDARKDLYFEYGFGLASDAPLNPATNLKINSDLIWEKHINRPDLDETAEPFSNLGLDFRTARAPWSFGLFASYLRSLESEEDTFVPGGRQERDDNTVIEYGWELGYAYDRLSATAGYIASQERHKGDQFKDGDEDVETATFALSYRLLRRLSAVYDFERELDDLIQDTQDYTGIEDTHLIGLEMDLWDRPLVTYGLGYEIEAEEEDEGEWEPVTTISVSQVEPFYITPTISLQLVASYSYEKEPEADDVGVEYGAIIRQQIDSMTTHNLSMTRRPVDTLGSTEDTTQTEFQYTFARAPFLLRLLSLAFSLTYEIDEPKESGLLEEETLDGQFRLVYSRPTWRNISRNISYEYNYEDSTLETEILEEHRWTLGFQVPL